MLRNEYSATIRSETKGFYRDTDSIISAMERPVFRENWEMNHESFIIMIINGEQTQFLSRCCNFQSAVPASRCLNENNQVSSAHSAFRKYSDPFTFSHFMLQPYAKSFE